MLWRSIRPGVALAVVAVLAGMLLGSAAAAARPAAGPIQLYATAGEGAAGTIVIAGAIGDHGKTLSMTKSGKPDPNGNYVRITLQKGGFEVDSTQLNKLTAKAGPSILSKATCSFAFTGKGPVTLFNGTGLYAGISGTVAITVNFVADGPLFASGKNKGRCNMSDNAKPLAQRGWIMGKGTVRFA